MIHITVTSSPYNEYYSGIRKELKMKIVGLIVFSVVSTLLLFAIYVYTLGTVIDRIAQDFSKNNTYITEDK